MPGVIQQKLRPSRCLFTYHWVQLFFLCACRYTCGYRLSLHLPPPVIVSNIDAQILQCKAQKPDRKTQILNSIRITHQPKWFLSPSKRKVRPSANVPFSHHIYISTALVLQHLKTSQNSRFPIFLDASFCLNVFTKMTVSKNETHFFSLSLSFLV